MEGKNLSEVFEQLEYVDIKRKCLSEEFKDKSIVGLGRVKTFARRKYERCSDLVEQDKLLAWLGSVFGKFFGKKKTINNSGNGKISSTVVVTSGLASNSVNSPDGSVFMDGDRVYGVYNAGLSGNDSNSQNGCVWEEAAVRKVAR